MEQLIDKLYETSALTPAEYKELIEQRTPELSEYLFEKARAVRIENYGHDVYIRGLIEFSNYCRNDCYYCGIRRSNHKAERYRLTKEQILESCLIGYDLGFRTFVLQGGEDGAFTDEKMVDIIGTIKTEFPDCAITLSFGEKSHESYKAFFDAGAERYLLRHETASAGHYGQLHPKSLTLDKRKQCLYDLKEIGYRWVRVHVGSPIKPPIASLRICYLLKS